MLSHLLITIAALLSLALPLAAQESLILLDTDASAFPEMRTRFYALDAAGKVIGGIGAGALRVTENGISRDVVSVSCPAATQAQPVSAVLTIDVSGSMAGGYLNVARGAAHAWIDMIDLNLSECAITSFDDGNYLNQDFTSDRQKLIAAVDALKPQGGTDYDQGFIGIPGGGLNIAKNGVHRRVMVFLTDGLSHGSYPAILSAAQAAGVEVYCVVLGLKAPQILKDIATGTGGAWYEEVLTADDARDIYRTILLTAQGIEPCTMIWRSGPACNIERALEAAMPGHGLTDSLYYQAPKSSRPGLVISPPELAAGLHFGKVGPGEIKDIEVTLTAQGEPITVTEITTAQGLFTILNGAPPAFTLAPGESRTITIRFAPADSIFATDRIIIAGNACDSTVLYALGGFPGMPPAGERLRLLHPDGGEIFGVGSDTVIRWEGVGPGIGVELAYSTDAGTNWLPVADSATGHAFSWNVPDTPGDSCLMRVRTKERRQEIIRRFNDGASIVACSFLFIGRRLVSVNKSVTKDVRTRDADLPNILGQFSMGGSGDMKADISPAAMLVALGRLNGSSIQIRNIQSGLQTAMIMNAGTVRFVRFSPDGGLLLGGEQVEPVAPPEFSIGIWNSLTGASMRRLRGLSESVVTGAWHPDGAGVALGDTREAIIFDGAGSIVRRIPVPGGVVSMAYSNSGGILATGSADGTLRLWNPSTGALMQTMAAHAGAINDITFAPDDRTLATGSTDKTAKHWSTLTGDSLMLFDPEGASITSIDFNPAGDLFMTAGDDGGITIWSIAPAQEDISDALWRIVRPRGQLKGIDMGRVQIGMAKDSVIAAFICNTGEVPLHVDDLSIEGTSRFSLVAGTPPVTIPPGTCQAIELRFNPDVVGEYLAALHLMTKRGSGRRDTISTTVRGTGIDIGARVLLPVIDFGSVPIGGWKDSIAVVLRNVGGSPIDVSVADAGPDLAQFMVQGGLAGFTLAPGETGVMTLRFAPVALGKTNGGLLLHVAGLEEPLHVSLFGEGICDAGGDPVEFRLPALSAAAGELVSIPLIIPSSADAVASGGGNFRASLRFNGTLLWPLADSIERKIEGDEMVITLNGALENGDTVVVVEFVAGLGNAEATPLVLEDLVWEGCPLAATFVQGEFRVNGICREGEGTRLFMDTDLLLKLNAGPDPARDHLRVHVGSIEGGLMRLSLLDALGREVRVLHEGDVLPGERFIDVDLGDVAGGVHFVVLQTASSRVVRSVRVVR